MTQWRSFDNQQDLVDAAVRRIGDAAYAAISARGCFNLVLAGGTTPLDCYRALAQQTQDFSSWNLYYGDERCLPTGDSMRNSTLVEQTGLVARAGAHYPMAAELGPIKGAELYAGLIKTVRPFDMVLLGVGEDGHTASLFPYDMSHWRNVDDPVIAVSDSPKPPSQRISLNLPVLQDCREMLVLITGAGKHDAVSRWRTGETLPIAVVSDIERAQVFVEQALLEDASRSTADV